MWIIESFTGLFQKNWDAIIVIIRSNDNINSIFEFLEKKYKLNKSNKLVYRRYLWLDFLDNEFIYFLNLNIYVIYIFYNNLDIEICEECNDEVNCNGEEEKFWKEYNGWEGDDIDKIIYKYY